VPAAAYPAGGVHDAADAPWLERSLFALDKFADRSVRGIQKFLFPEHSEVMAAAQQELSMNTAMADLYEKGPLGRARRLRSASYSQPGACPPSVLPHGPSPQVTSRHRLPPVYVGTRGSMCGSGR